MFRCSDAGKIPAPYSPRNPEDKSRCELNWKLKFRSRRAQSPNDKPLLQDYIKIENELRSGREDAETRGTHTVGLDRGG